MRMKDIQNEIPNALNKVMSLSGYYYKGNELAGSLGYDTDKLEVGLSAQDVKAILPEVVQRAAISYNEGVQDDLMTVNYPKLVPLLVQSIKELKTELDELKSSNS